MTARHLSYYKKKIFIVVSILVTALLISGIVIYTEMFSAKAMDQNKLNKEVTAVEPSVETNEAPAQETSEVIEPITKPVTAQPKPTVQENPLPFNQLVLAQIETYNKGSYPYLLNTDYTNYISAIKSSSNSLLRIVSGREVVPNNTFFSR